MVFVEEEKERYMESVVETSIAKEAGLADAEGGGPSATLRSLESVKGGERLMECMDIVEAELKVLDGIAERTQGMAKGNTVAAAAARRVKNPVLLGMSPYKFLVHTLRQIKAPDMEQALLVLPFHYVSRLLAMLLQLAHRSLDLEQCARITVFLLRCHYAQISVTAELVPVLLDLKALLVTRLSQYRGLIGSNVAGLKIMHREVKEDASAYFVDFSEPVPGGPGGHLVASGAKGGGSSSSSKGNKKRKHKGED
jgi:U3 small nucleolar RNA-associated protein 12